MMRSLAALSALAAISLATPAAADIMRATYTGVVREGGFDGHGTFFNGVHFSEFAGGEAFTAIFVYDTSAGSLTTGEHRETLLGGANAPGGPFSTFFQSGSFTLNGVTLNIVPGSNDKVEASDSVFLLGSRPGLITHSAFFLEGSGADQVEYALSMAAFVPIAADVEAELDLDLPLSPTNTGFGGFTFIDNSPSLPHAISAGGSVFATHLTIQNLSVAGVPEPATWAMMIAGFGAVGTVLRRRVRAVSLT